MLCSEAVPRKKTKPRWFSRKKREGLLHQICNNDNLQRRRKQHHPISSLTGFLSSLYKISQHRCKIKTKKKTNLDDITTKLEPTSVRFQQGHNKKQRKFQK
jgi:hypothetical protein